MRTCFSTNVFACLFLHLASTASAEDARAILDRAIQAHGGADRLERTKKGHLKAKIDANISNIPFKAECEETFDLPGRYKRIVDGSNSDPPFHMEYAIIGKEGWLRKGTEPPRDISVRDLPTVEQQWHAVLAQLLLLREKDVQFTLIPKETKEGRTLVGIHIVSPQGSGDMFFDKSTGLVARAQRSMPNLLGDQEAFGENIFDDYRDIQGVQFPMRFRAVAGKSFSTTVTLTSIEFGGKIDESVFIKPQMPDAEKPQMADPEPSSENAEKSPVPRDRMLIVATVGAGAVVGAVWFIVRVSKRGKRETPPS